MSCSNAAKTRNPLKFAGCLELPDRSQPLVGRSSPYCGDMWRTYLCLTSFFPIVDTCLSCEVIARQSCAMVPRWRFLATFLRPAFPASRVRQVSDLHLKFALRPHHVSATGVLQLPDHVCGTRCQYSYGIVTVLDSLNAEDRSVWWLGPRRFVTLVRSAVYKSSYLLTYLCVEVW